MQFLIYIISFLEGFTTLSIQMIAIRNFTPIVGSNSISTSIVIGVILLALSYGYYKGGKYSKNKDEIQIKQKIILNLTLAGIYYLFFTFLFDKYIILTLLEINIGYFLSILISSFILFFIPIFLASQTIPLLSEILRGDNTGEKIGKLLFFSTIGSFLGAIMTSSLLFPILGVEKSAILNTTILTFLAILLWLSYTKKAKTMNIISFLIFALSISILVTPEKNKEGIIYQKANSYHNIKIVDDGDYRIFMQNNGYSSGINKTTKQSFFKYIIEMKNQIIENNYENIAIIGAAGFTLPYELSLESFTKNIDVVDVDSSLKNIAEKYFLEEKLNNKINFKANASRFFLNQTIKNNKKYDAIVIDIYHGDSLPPQTLTKEFFDSLTKVSENIYINMITDTSLESDFSKKLLNTMKSSFGDIYYLDVNNNKGNSMTNFIMTNKNIDGYNLYNTENNFGIYTDNKHSIELDLYKIR